MIMDRSAKQDFQIKQLNNPAVFGWGIDDVETLKEIYPKYFTKFIKQATRADLWKPLFSNYWNVPSKIPEKPFLLISCNTGYSNNINCKMIKFENEIGHRATLNILK